MGLPDHVIRLSDPQFGVFARFQVVNDAFGITDDQVHGWLMARLIERFHRGVYRVAGSGRSPRQAAMAALLRSRPEAVLTGPFVLGLLDVDGFTVQDDFEVLLRPGRRMRNVPFRFRTDDHPSRTVASQGPLRFVTPTDALIDTAGSLATSDERRLRVGLDSATWRSLTSPARVLERARELGPGHAGARYFLDLLADGHERCDTDGERRLGDLVNRFDPRPEPQVWVTPARRPDWFFRLIRLAIEYLGDVDHGFAARRAADLVRDADLDEVGVAVLPVVAADLRDPEAATRWIEAAVVRRAFELGVPAPRLVR